MYHVYMNCIIMKTINHYHTALCNTSDNAHGAGVVPLQHVTLPSSPVCVKETPTIDPTECADTVMPSKPEPVLKGYKGMFLYSAVSGP